MRVLNLQMIRLSIALGITTLLASPGLAADTVFVLDDTFGFVIEDDTTTIERLRVDEATGNVSRNGALFVHTTGASNLFVGPDAGDLGTTGPGRNSAFGDSALTSLTLGQDNAAFGKDALRANTTGAWNAAFGDRSLYTNTQGYGNSAFGQKSLYTMDLATLNSAFGYKALELNTTGFSNTGIGANALALTTTGDFNVAIGNGAGAGQTTGDNNIYISNPGVAAESGKIRIGDTAHDETFIDGIDGNIATGGVTVLINSSNELHTIVSSARFKQDVVDMGESSERLAQLRPVTFRYREQVALGEDVAEYGLIAEEVAEIAPELVAYDAEGKPYSVRYHVLAPMLLNELQKQQRTVDAQRAQLGLESERNAAQQDQITKLLSRLEALEARLTGADVEAP